VLAVDASALIVALADGPDGKQLTVDDAPYVSLADALDVALLTADARIARAPGLPQRLPPACDESPDLPS
jgi:hypothetical protein